MAETAATPDAHYWLRQGAGAATAAAAIAALLCVDGQVGPLSLTLRRAVALVVLICIGTSGLGRGERLRIADWGGLLAALAVLARAPAVPIALLAFVMALAAVAMADRPSARGAAIPSGVVQACLSYVALRLAADLAPQAARIQETIADEGSRYISQVRGLDSHLSLTALGGPPVAMAVLYLLWSWRKAGGLARLAAATALPVGWFAFLAPLAPDVSAGPLASFWRGSLHGLGWLGLAIVATAVLPLRRRAGRSTRQSSMDEGLAACGVGRSLAVGGGLRPPDGSPPWARWVGAGRSASPGGAASQSGSAGASPSRSIAGARGRHLCLVAACVAAAMAGVCLVGTALIEPATAKSIVVHNRGGLDWDRPVFGRFGAFSGGMFGLWPVYCRAEGYAFSVIDKETIVTSDLEKAQILVLINSPKQWEGAERRTIFDFVARGGSLLVLGDHTDVFGLMRGFNSLLGPLGIQFRFDSAYKARETWRGCQAAAPDAVAWGWDVENPGVAVGASLELSGSARPLLVGRYGFSDNGARENAMGSFLGNYHYDKGERLGDVVLVATAAYGRGRVVVWGDTSAFQGVNSYYPTVVGPMLAWMSRPAAWTERPPFRVAAAAGLIATVVWLWIAGGTVVETAIIAVSLLAGLAVPWALGLANMDARVHTASDTVLIDRSHLPASGHYEARVNPVGPLYTNLLRSGFRVVDMADWDSKAIARARAIAFVAPQRSFSHREIQELLRAEDRGAVVILNTGEPDSTGSRALLAAHGLALAPRPMGAVTSATLTASRRERESQPRFYDAWPIVAAEGEGNPAALPGVEVVYKQGNDVVALFRRAGKGGLLLFADTRFFSDMNVEDMSGYWPGNLALIHDLFCRYLGAEPDAVKPLFPSPTKPE